MASQPGELWGIYCRISRVRRQDGKLETLGVDRQEPPCRELVKRKGGVVHHVYVDNDLSAYSGKRRPDYEAILADAEAGIIKGITALHPDRLSRDPDRDNVRIMDLHDHHGTQLATVLAGDHDLSTPAGRMMFRQLGILARYESEHRAERNRLKHLEIARDGKPNGGMRPFGFEDDRVTIEPYEAALIEDAARRLLKDGHKLSQIVKDWNQRQIPTTTGSTWQLRTLKRILLSARVVGQRQHGDNIHPAVWPAILDPATQTALKLLLNAHPTPTQPVRKYILTGLLFCGRPDCGGKLDGQTRMNGKRSYECRHCFKLTRLADPIEREVRNQAFDVLASPDVTRAILRAHDTDQNIERARAQLQRDQDALDALLASNVLTDREHRKKTKQLQARAEAIAARLPTPGPRLLSLPGSETVEGYWLRNKDDLGKRRELLSLAIEKIVLLPTVRGRRTFDPDAELDIHWQPVIPPELVAAVLRQRDA